MNYDEMELPVVGIRYNEFNDLYKQIAKDAALSLEEKHERLKQYKVSVIFEENNPYDRYAVAILFYVNNKWLRVGYLCKLSAKFIFTMFHHRKNKIRAEVSSKTPPNFNSNDIFIRLYFE